MTISSSTASASYTGNGTTQIFTVPFYFLVDTDVKVSKKVAATGAISVLTLNSDYTLTGAGNQAGGSATLVTAPASGDTIFIERNVDAVQETAYPENGIFPAASHERALDRLTMLVQQIKTALGFKLGKDPLADHYDVDANKVSNAADGTASTDLTTLQQVINLVNAATTGVANYIAFGVGSIARAVNDKLRERPSVVDYGADPTGAASSVSAFNDALTACDDVFIPPGTYLIDDAVSLATGKRLRGAGRRKTILHMPSTFNAAALGALVFTGGEPGPEVSGLTIIQDQPDSTTATVYPPCIYARTAARFLLRNVRLPCVYAGIDMKGNCGGAVIDDLELSALSVGIDIDGPLDTIRISKIHLWPFGGAGSGTLTANQTVSFKAAYGVKTGRCDGLSISDSLFYEQASALYTYSSASGSTFGQIANTGFDGDAQIKMGAGSIEFIGGYISSSSGANNWINMTGGELLLSGTRLVANAAFSGNGGIDVSGGVLTATGCYSKSGALDTTHYYASGSATLQIAGGAMSRTGSGSYSKPTVQYAGTSTGSVSGVYLPKRTSALGTFVQVDADSGVSVAGNNAAGWSVSTPSGALTNTRVDGNLGTNKDTFSGYFSSDASTTVKLPSGWTVSRLGVGNYQLSHNLSLASAYGMIPDLTADNATAGTHAVASLAESTTAALRVRTYVGSTATDAGVFFTLRRYRS